MDLPPEEPRSGPDPDESASDAPPAPTREPGEEPPAGQDPAVLGPLASPLAGGALLAAAWGVHAFLTADPDAPC